MERFKYPRTYHHPLSMAVQDDDKTIDPDHLKSLLGQEVVLTVKMDGENATIYPDGYTHARSVDSKYHPSRTWLKSFASTIAYQIPEGHRICGENLYAQHSIKYDNLDSYFEGFSVWQRDTCLSWDDTVDIFKDLGIQPVFEVWRGVLDDTVVSDFINLMGENDEGFVVRSVEEIHANDFDKKVFKVVRANHVQTDKHWMNQEVKPNALKST